MDIFGTQAMLGAIGNGIRLGTQQLGRSMGQSLASWRPGVRQPQMAPDMVGGWGQQGMGQRLADNMPSGRRQQWLPDIGGMDSMPSSGGSGGGSGGGQDWTDNRFGSAYNQIGQLQNDIQNGRDGNSGQALDYHSRQEKQQKIRDLYKNTQNWDGETQRQLAQVQDEDAKLRAREYMQKPRLYRGEQNTNEMMQAEGAAKWGVGAQQAYADGGRIGWGAGNQQGENLRAAAKRGVPVSGMLMDKGNFDAKVYDQGQSIYNPAAGSAADPFGWLGRSTYQTMGIGANNTSDTAYGGGGVWNPAAWGSHYEQGGGYDASGGAQGQWNKFHQNNLSFGGGNYIGSSPEQDANRLSWGNMPATWGRAGVFPPGSEFYGPNGAGGRQEADWQRQQNPEGIVPGMNYPPGWRPPIYDHGTQRITSSVYDVPNGGAVGSGRLSTSLGNDVFDQGSYGSTSQQAPRMSNAERILTQYRNMADGFDGGYFGAQTGAYSGVGNYRPKSFWMTK
jgi:hypothetical protein